MKTRQSLVSNSSSTSFMIDLSSIKDEETYKIFWEIVNDDLGSCYIEPEFENKGNLYLSTGMSQGNQCLYNWWKLKKFLISNKIKHEDCGDGCPGPEEKACDFVCYITEQDEQQEPDPSRIQQLRDWLYKNIPNERIEKAAKEIEITKEEILNATFNRDIIDEVLKGV